MKGGPAVQERSQSGAGARASSAAGGPLADLRARFAAGDLALFLGAGVSLSAGLPGWESLLHRLTVEMWAQRLGADAGGGDAEEFARLFRHAFSGFPIISGRYIRKALGESFQERVRSILYSHPEATSGLLKAVTRLCVPPGNGAGIRAVVCYNYDDLLETHLARRRVPFCSVNAEGQSPPTQVLPVYHVHGYLPRDGSLDHGSEIVFAEDAYHTQFLDPYAWSNITQLNLLRERTGLFVGFSMTDPNLRRLLDVANRYRHGRPHHVILRTPPREQVVFGDTSQVSDDRLDAFIRAFRSVQEDALAELGLQIVWVDSFDNIPRLLDRIRQPGRRAPAETAASVPEQEARECRAAPRGPSARGEP